MPKSRSRQYADFIRYVGFAQDGTPDIQGVARDDEVSSSLTSLENTVNNTLSTQVSSLQSDLTALDESITNNVNTQLNSLQVDLSDLSNYVNVVLTKEGYHVVKAGDTPPVSPVVGQLWLDTTNRNVVKSYTGTEWLTCSNLFDAQGGDVVVYTSGPDTYKAHIFNSSSALNVSGTGAIDILIVAGGGGGGTHACPGGGGAGGLIYIEDMVVSAGTYPITVGAGHPAVYSQSGSYGYIQGGRGGNSNAFDLTAIGGGSGVSWDAAHNLNNISGGSTGGYGTGGSVNSGVPTAQQPIQSGDSGTFGYGNRGGNGVYFSTPYPGGGGGGAGQVGQDSPNGSTSGNGAYGRQYDISGTPKYYAGGGGGGGWAFTNGRLGSGINFGGGGDGDSGDGSGQGVSARGFNGYSVGQDGYPNTGGGGGGAGRTGGQLSIGGAGGSGVVIVRYKL